MYHFFVLGEFRGFRAYQSIAGVVLCVTGAEALYADMGHFGAGWVGWTCFLGRVLGCKCTPVCPSCKNIPGTLFQL